VSELQRQLDQAIQLTREAMLPNFEQPLDMFETRIENFCKRANPDQLLLLINRASVYVEKAAEKAADGPGAEHLRYDGWTYFNNATSAINTAARELRKRI
jgi:hypothetical protein